MVVTPGIWPARMFVTSATGALTSDLLSMDVSAPVTVALVCVPYATTTVASRVWVSSRSTMVNVRCLPTVNVSVT